MKRLHFVIIILAILIIIPILTRLLIVDVKEIPATVNVGGYIGVNVDTDKLYFGTLGAGNYAERSIHIENYKCGKCIVTIKSKGEISRWLGYSDAKFRIFKGEIKTVNVTLSIPKNAHEGTYDGTVRILFWKTI